MRFLSRAAWEQRVWQFWQQDDLRHRLLWPLTYPVALANRRPFSTATLPCSVIVVGNWTVGGTGKTPLVQALATQVRGQNYRVGIVSRGYGRLRRETQFVKPDSDPFAWGDEAVLHAQADFPVVVARRRREGVEWLAKAGIEVVIADDGLQHRSMPRDAEIAVIDPEIRFGNGYLLPIGPLREPPRPVDLTAVRDTDFTLSGDEAVNLLTQERRSLATFRDRSVVALAGIGQPQRFFAHLQAHNLRFVPHRFPDHRRFTAREMAQFFDQTVLMTAKDGVKCRRWATGDFWFVPMTVTLSPAFTQQFQQLLLKVMVRG